MKEIAVLINFYKPILTLNEINSLKICISLLGDYDLILLGPENVDLKEYTPYIGDLKLHLVKTELFKGNENYNKFLLSEEFYLAFKDYKYILIYQLDCFVFKDDLRFWANQDYDFIGAPLFETSENNTNYKFIGVGNGGLSFRNPKNILKILQNWEKEISYKNILTSQYCNRKQKLKLIKSKTVALLSFYKIHTSLNSILNRNEDSVLGLLLSKELGLLKTPTPEFALKFSMEAHPRFLFKMNKNELPFGCHAWEKHDKSFWEDFIIEN